MQELTQCFDFHWEWFFQQSELTFGTDFLHALAIIGVLSAFFGSLISLVSTDIKRLIAYSSIAHMGYIMFGLSLFPANATAGTVVLLASSIAIAGTVLHIISHALSKGLLFLGAGGVMHQTEKRDIRKMGGLASKMPFTAVSSTIAALSIGGAPPFACFISEFLIFVGAFQIIHVDSFYIIPTALMLIATVISLAYMLRFTSNVFLGQPEDEEAELGRRGQRGKENVRGFKLHEAIVRYFSRISNPCWHLPDILPKSNSNGENWLT